MRSPLFDGLNEVANKEVIEKMNYFNKEAEKIMKIHELDKKSALELAKKLRNELETEYKKNDLIRTRKIYRKHELFSTYQRAVHEASVSVTGVLSYKKLFSFLYDVKSYMSYSLPPDHE